MSPYNKKKSRLSGIIVFITSAFSLIVKRCKIINVKLTLFLLICKLFTKKFYTERFGFAEDEFDIVETPAKSNDSFNTPHSHSDFKQAEEFDDQILIDKLALHTLEGSNNVFNNITSQITNFIQNAKSYEEVKNNIHKLLPELDTKELEDKLLSAMFLANTIGKLSVQDENTEGISNE